VVAKSHIAKDETFDVVISEKKILSYIGFIFLTKTRLKALKSRHFCNKKN